MNEQKKSIFSNHEIMCRALKDSFIKLNPRTQIKNPVMFMVFVSAILTFVMFLFSLAGIIRQLCGSHSRGKGKGPGRCPACRQKGYYGIQDSFG